MSPVKHRDVSQEVAKTVLWGPEASAIDLGNGRSGRLHTKSSNRTPSHLNSRMRVAQRKFRNQTFDNTEKWKSRGRKSQRREEEKERRSEKRTSQKKEDAGGQKVEKKVSLCFFHWFVAPEGRKVGSLKRRARRHLVRWEMKNCTPLWREAHVEVKMYKAPWLRSTCRSWDNQKVHAAVAQSRFRCQNAENTSRSDHFSKLSWWRNAPIVGRSTFPSQNVQADTRFGTLFEVEISRKCTPSWCEAHFQVKSGKNWNTFGRSDAVLRSMHKGFCTVPKVSKTCAHLRNFNYNHYTTLHSTTTTTTRTTTTTTLHYPTLH